MKKKIDVFDYSKLIIDKLRQGVLITTKDKKINSMTISWGAFGIEWGKPIFTAYVRESRFTKQQLDATMEFTVNIPMNTDVQKILSFCGTKSGRDTDKIAELSLNLEESESIGAPGIKELPLTLECKVINKQIQLLSALPDDVRKTFYPPCTDGKSDVHFVYYGEIVSAYIIE